MQGRTIERVAELMADEVDYQQISVRLGLTVATVYARAADIRRDLGPQASHADLGWRGGRIWHPGRP